MLTHSTHGCLKSLDLNSFLDSEKVSPLGDNGAIKWTGPGSLSHCLAGNCQGLSHLASQKEKLSNFLCMKFGSLSLITA